MEPYALVSIGFVMLAIFLVSLGLRSAYLSLGDRRMRRRLQEITLSSGQSLEVDPLIIRDIKLSAVPPLNRLLQKFRLGYKLETLLVQGDLSITAGTLSLLCLTLAGLGALIAIFVFSRPWLGLPAGVILGALPFFVVYRKKQQRMQMFEEQLPDALDLITGALRSGMAFIGALQLVAEESPDPIAKEFNAVFEEQRLGLGLQESLTNMTARVDRRELQLFVTAVLLQRDTGGNLAEILEGAATVIRDRFRILGDVRTITAQARFTGLILAVLPLGMAGVLVFLAPDYLRILITDPIGPYLIAVAVGLQLVGYFVIRRICTIKV